MRVLLVEDEPLIGEATREVLEDEAFAVDLATTGSHADELMAVNDYDVAILDWSLPPPTGIELLRRWRAAGVAVPVLMLTARADVTDRVAGLDAGADDYLAKPFAFDELLARVRALLRRREQRFVGQLAAGDLEMDRAKRSVTVGGEPVKLSPREFAVLEYLLRRVDEVVTRTDLSEHVWDESFDGLSNVIDVTVHRLRRKIEDKGTENFPTAAGRKLYGELTMILTVNREGRVIDVGGDEVARADGDAAVLGDPVPLAVEIAEQPRVVERQAGAGNNILERVDFMAQGQVQPVVHVFAVAQFMVAGTKIAHIQQVLAGSNPVEIVLDAIEKVVTVEFRFRRKLVIEVQAYGLVIGKSAANISR